MLTRFTPPEHIPVFRALLEIEIEIKIEIDPHQSTDEARSAPVRPSKIIAWEGHKHTTHKQTLQLLDQLGPDGRVRENIHAKKSWKYMVNQEYF